MNNFLILFITTFSLKPTYFTNHNYYYDIVAKDSLVYGATNGGVVKYNFLSGSFNTLTNTDGLQINRQSCIALDSADFIWVGNEKGLAQIDKGFKYIQSYPPQHLPATKVNAICCLKDTVLVGTTGGFLIIFTNKTPDNFNDDVTIKFFDLNVTSITSGNDFWIGTDDGLYRFSKDLQNSIHYTTVNGLLSNYINKVLVSDTTVYVATKSGINYFADARFDTLLYGYEINDIEVIGDSLLLAMDTLHQVGVLFQGNLQIIKDSLPYRTKVYDVENVNGNWICATGSRWELDYFGDGLGFYDFNNHYWTLKKDSCLGSNHICSISANEYGVFIAHGRRGVESKGVSWLTIDNKWKLFCRDSFIPTKFIHRCVTAPDRKVWFAFHYTDSLLACSFDPQDSTWFYLPQKYKGIDTTVAIWDMKFDTKNNIFLSFAGPSDRIWVLDSSLSQATFLGSITKGHEVEMAIDASGRVYSTVTGAEGGLLMIDTKGTLFNRGDDEEFKFGTSSGMVSKYAWGCIVDQDNILYIANECGLTIYDTKSFQGIKDISDGEIFDVELDSENRVWMMTQTGIYYYDPVFKFHTGWRYSDLGISIEFLPISQEVIQIQGFEFDPIRRCFWLGGETGLLRLEVEFDETIHLDSILICPNPVINGKGVRIKNLSSDAVVYIYSVAGRLMAKDLKPNLFGEVYWEFPSSMGSGLYFALVRTEAGKKVFKFAVVR